MEEEKKVVTGSPEENVLIEKTKKLSIKEASAYSFMDGFGLRYVGPYALAVGANNTQMGLLSSLPGLIGNLSQLFTIKAMRRWTRKKIIFSGVLLQAIMWLFLIGAGIPFFIYGIKNDFSPNAVIIIYTILALVGAFAGPAWSSMMRDLVPKNRGEYFGNRNRIAGLVALICMFVAGFILDYFKQTHIFIGFAIMFFIAFIGRFISAMTFRKHYDPKFCVDDKKYFTIWDFIKKMRQNNFGRFVMYFSLLSFACAIASPFFVVLYFKDLNFTYTQYMITAVANSVASLLLMPLWGKFADKYGNLKVMKINGFLIPLLPLFYIFTLFIHSQTLMVLFIVLLEVYSGVIWAGFNLAAGNFIYDAVSKERLAICSSYFNIINGFCALIGALIGGYLSSHNVSLLGLTPLLSLFIISGIVRFIIYFSLSGRINEVREVKGFDLANHLSCQAKKITDGTKKFTKNLLKSVSLDRFFETMISESEHNFSSDPNNFVKNN